MEETGPAVRPGAGELGEGEQAESTGPDGGYLAGVTPGNSGSI